MEKRHETNQNTNNKTSEQLNEPAQANSEVANKGIEEAEDSQADILKQILMVQNEANLMKDQLARALADLENLRKRTLREKVELRQIAAAAVMEDLIPALDNIRMGIASGKQSPDAKGITDGFIMVYEQLKKILSGHGLEEIIPTDATFDLNFHECVSRQHHPTIPEGHIIEIVRPGYTLNGKLLRAASVIASSGPEV